MKILSLTVQNIKRIKAVSIIPDGNTVIISGKNGNGKSSTLDSIAIAIGGKKLMPSQPVRNGEENALIEMTTDKYKISRHWTSPEKSYLKVEMIDGGELKSPQTILDDLVGNLSFDPLEFSTMESKKRAEVIRELTGLDFSDLEKEHQEVYSQRTILNKEGQSLKGLLESFSDLPETLPDLDIKEIKQKRSLDEAHNSIVKKSNEQIIALNNENESIKRTIEESKNEILELNRKIEKIRDYIGDQLGKIKHNESSMEGLKETASMSLRDLSGYDTALMEYSQNESNKKRLIQRNELKAKKDKVKEEWEAKDARIKAIAEEKETRLKNAKMPIDGLSLGDGEVLFNGIPFTQLCTSEQIRISMAVAISLNPKLRVVMIKNGSLLDSEAMKEVSAIAEANDFQVWIEKVQETPDGNSIFIEDGEVLA